MPQPKVLFLHGLEGGPEGRKARALRAALGDAFVAPDLRERDPVERLELAERALASLSSGPHLLAGSSLGGWLAALLAQRCAERVARLVLFAPAFQPASWGGETFESFSPEAKALAGLPEVACPARVVVAAHDEIIPGWAAREWVERTPGARIEVWADGHRLQGHLERIVAVVSEELRALAEGAKV